MKVDDGVAVFQGKRRESGGGVVPGGGSGVGFSLIIPSTRGLRYF